jgi:hypothetical protein
MPADDSAKRGRCGTGGRHELGRLENATAQFPAARQRIDPADRERAGGPRLGERGEEPVEIGNAPGAHRKPARARQQAERRAHDDAGETHAADRGAEEVRIVLHRGTQRAAVGEHHVEPYDMVAVHVGGDGAAHGDPGGSRRDRGHEAARHERVDQIAERDPRLAFEDAGRSIEGEHPVEAGGQDRATAGRPCRIAVGAPGPAREHDAAGRTGGGQRFAHACPPFRSRGKAARRRTAPPAFEPDLFPAHGHA